MHRHARRLTAVALSLALGLALVGDGGRAADVPRTVSGAMVLARVEPDELTKYLQRVILEELRAAVPDGSAVKKVRGIALLIAARAQNGRGARDSWQRTSLRENALRLHHALAEGKTELARRQAAALFDMSTGPAARLVDLRGLMEQDEVETLLAVRRRGGLGFGPGPAAANPRDSIEIKLIVLSRKPLLPAELDAEAEPLARAAAVIEGMAGLIDVYAPTKKVGNKDPNDWKTLIGDMRLSAQELESAARAKDAPRIRAAALKVNASCNGCHGIFRD
jgi:hypothetical protein